MNRTEFVEEISELLEVADPIQGDTLLEDIPEFDSLAVLNLLSLYDEMGISLKPEQITEAVTVEDLVGLAGNALTDD